MGPVVTYCIDLVHLPEDAVLNTGDLKPCLWLCLGDVITAMILLSISWSPRTALCQYRTDLRKHIKGGLGTWAVLGIL